VLAFTRMMEGYFHEDSGHWDMGLFGQDDIETWWRENLRPEQISPVIGWLAHESCDVSGETLMSGGGFVTRQFVGFTQGYANADLTPELVAANRESIFDIGAIHAYGAPGTDNWTFRRMVEGGAPMPPAPKSRGRAGRST
jgi:hypothetical protein